MEVIWIMIPISILLAFSFLAWFILASKNNQFEDLDSPPRRILFDDEDNELVSNNIRGNENE